MHSLCKAIETGNGYLQIIRSRITYTVKSYFSSRWNNRTSTGRRMPPAWRRCTEILALVTLLTISDDNLVGVRSIEPPKWLMRPRPLDLRVYPKRSVLYADGSVTIQCRVSGAARINSRPRIGYFVSSSLVPYRRLLERLFPVVLISERADVDKYVKIY